MSPTRRRRQCINVRAVVEIHFRGSWKVRFGPGGLYQRLAWRLKKPDGREQKLGVLGICVANSLISALRHGNIQHHFVDVDLHYASEDLSSEDLSSEDLRSDEFADGSLCVRVLVETQANTELIQALLEEIVRNDSIVRQLMPRRARITLSALTRPSDVARM